MEEYNELLENNKRWVQQQQAHDPDFFTRLAAGQSPRAFWIGCSDSRVPETQITGMGPGDIFVQRNVANQVIHDDINLLTSLQYAVLNLEVGHVIVCGHYGCGGVKAAMSNVDLGLINQWLLPVKNLIHQYEEELEGFSDEQRAQRLVELNVVQQAKNLLTTSAIQKSWQKRKAPHIHGWVFGLNDGQIKELINIEPDMAHIPEAYRMDVHD